MSFNNIYYCIGYSTMLCTLFDYNMVSGHNIKVTKTQTNRILLSCFNNNRLAISHKHRELQNNKLSLRAKIEY